MKSIRAFWLLLSASCVAFLCGCASGSLSCEPRSQNIHSGIHELFLRDTDGISRITMNQLNRNGLYGMLRKDPTKLLVLLEQLFRENQQPSILSVMVDVARMMAMEKAGMQDAVAFHLTVLLYSQTYLEMEAKQTGRVHSFNPEHILVVYCYNYSTSELFRIFNAAYKDDDKRSNFYLLRKKNHGAVFSDATGNKIEIAPIPSISGFREDARKQLRICSDFESKNLNFFNIKFGIGAPLIAEMNSDLLSDAEGVLRYTPGMALAQTVVFKMEAAQKDANGTMVRRGRFEFCDANETEQVQLGSNTCSLAADFSTPLVYQLRHSNISGVWELINPDFELFGSPNGVLYCMDKLVPDKIPLVFVHGLMSNSATWGQVYNSLRYNSEIRKRFQIWYFSYPTGNSILFSSEQLRHSLRQMRAKYFANDRTAAKNFDRMVVVGHSMGGLLAKTMMVSSGNVLSDFVLKDRLHMNEDQLDVETRKLLDRYLRFSPESYPGRVIFLATPHQGSFFADNWIGRFGSFMARLPGETLRTVAAPVKSLLGKDNDMDKMKIDNGIDNLQPSSPILTRLAKMPFRKDLPYHSIIGDATDDDRAGGGDGIVLYSSSHLPGAQSEMIVKSDHSVQKNPRTALEIMRILLLHLQTE